ncbi:hypothetical protein [Bacillus niameyensis]|uniref:hypothetical protein n=1 Tax=Bacillus niameyensis TaxID=1522308 RepID=UPI0007817D4E|nr:hypothetical protein [Bacillus niameyensis]
MTEFRFLKLLDVFKPFFRMVKVDYSIMRRILETKLLMDQRRTPTIFANRPESKQKGNQFLKSLGIYALYGLLLIMFVIMKQHYMFQMSIVFSITLFLLMTTLISDFSTVLLDVRDKTILHTKPLNLRTVNAAKLIHISYYMAMITGAFILIPSIVILFRQGTLFFLIFVLEIILVILFIMTFTALIYLFILKVFGSEQLKDIINYVQIILSVGVVVGYQVAIRAFNFVDLQFSYTFEWWHFFIPPIWFAAPFELLISHNIASEYIVLSILAIVMPIVSLFAYIWLMPSFERNLQKLMGETGVIKKRHLNLWEKIVCFDDEEKMYFRFASLMMSREREFKLKVYPLLGMALVFPFIFVMNAIMSEETLINSKVHLNIYFSTIIVGTVVHMIKFSKNYKAGWIFHAIPLKSEKRFYSAALKAFLVRLYLPIYLIVSIIFMVIFSWRIWPDLLIVFVSAVLMTVLAYKVINNERFPFTRPVESAQEGINSFKVFLVIFVAGAFAGLHLIVLRIPYGIIGYFIVLVLITGVLWKWTFGVKKMV